MLKILKIVVAVFLFGILLLLGVYYKKVFYVGSGGGKEIYLRGEMYTKNLGWTNWQGQEFGPSVPYLVYTDFDSIPSNLVDDSVKILADSSPEVYVIIKEKDSYYVPVLVTDDVTKIKDQIYLKGHTEGYTGEKGKIESFESIFVVIGENFYLPHLVPFVDMKSIYTLNGLDKKVKVKIDKKGNLYPIAFYQNETLCLSRFTIDLGNKKCWTDYSEKYTKNYSLFDGRMNMLVDQIFSLFK